MLEKGDVRRKLYFHLFADNHRKRDMLRITTSGSTGRCEGARKRDPFYVPCAPS